MPPRRGHISADDVVEHARFEFTAAGESFGPGRERQIRKGADIMSQAQRAVSLSLDYHTWSDLAGDSAQISARHKRNPWWYGS